jgi:hypothetical protein
LEEAMAVSEFDAKQVGDLAFGQGQLPSVNSTHSGKSDEEVSEATDAFLKAVFYQSADSRTASNSYQDARDIETYLESLMTPITSDSDNTTSVVSANTGASKLVQSASTLLKASGIDTSSENLQSFMQILQKNMAASMEDKSNLVGHSV